MSDELSHGGSASQEKEMLIRSTKYVIRSRLFVRKLGFRFLTSDHRVPDVIFAVFQADEGSTLFAKKSSRFLIVGGEIVLYCIITELDKGAET
jgi:hypothetical protein